jgi:GNAT superfamily N-acetyltransferase
VTERTRFVAEVAGVPAGTVSVGPSDAGGVASITAMWVDPGFRRHGVATALVARALEWARGARFVSVLLWVAEGNVAAEQLYVRHGFARTGSVELIRPGDDRVEYEMARPL